jgi:RND family efflux transporter MFP subunit
MPFKLIICFLVILLIPLFFLTISCNDSRAEIDKVPPAMVENPVKESNLTTLTLTPEATNRLGIETAVVEYRKIRRIRTVGGEVMIPPGCLAVISAPMAGILTAPQNENFPGAGSSIKKGQTLFHLLVLPSSGDLISTRDDIAEQQVRLKASKAKAVRAEQLLKAYVGSRQQYEEALAEFATTEAALKTAQNRLEILNKTNLNPRDSELTTLRIESPDDGILKKIHAMSGQTVAAGTPLIEIVNLSILWVRVPVYAGDIATFDINEAVFVNTLGFSGTAAIRKIRPVSAPPTADPLAASVDLYFELKNYDGSFHPGERVNVSLTLRSEGETMIIPYSAIVYDIHGGTWVYQQTAPQVFVRRPNRSCSCGGWRCRICSWSRSWC